MEEQNHIGVTLADNVHPFNINDYTIRNNDPLAVPGGVRFNVPIDLSGDALSILQELAMTQGITLAEALRKAIATEAYLHEKTKKGHTLLLISPDKEIREVVFR